MKTKLFDYHTQSLEHGLGKHLRLSETIESAIRKGLSAICLTDHYPFPSEFIDPTPDKTCAMVMEEYKTYQRKVSENIKVYQSKIEVLRGAEVDWLPEYEEWTQKQITRWNFDYCIGSVHFLGQIKDEIGQRNFALDYTKEEFRNGITYYGGIEVLIKKYYAQICRMALSGLFDGVGHFDLVKKFNGGDLFDQSSLWYRKVVEQALDCIQKTGLAVEINTAGLDKKCKEQYPSLWVIYEAQKRDIPITIGSDAHIPENVGRNLGKAIEMAKKMGYTKLVRFKKRQKIEVAI
ncbi:histidinol-phosphatase HisJ [Candidatus Gottesmanbacteria bacterium]|nr:histidinol-phosphatase HisJ [Candidatus Gottesmanbacteria bacterium]